MTAGKVTHAIIDGRQYNVVEVPGTGRPGEYRGSLYGRAELASSGGSRPVARKPRRLAVPDAPGNDLRPDPLEATCAAELVSSLRDYHIWAGEPAIRAMARQCDQMISAATLYRAMNKKALPSFDAVQAFIIGCGGSEEDQQRYATAWRRIRSGRVASARPLRAVPSAKTG
jgi:hypothetical protein